MDHFLKFHKFLGEANEQADIVAHLVVRMCVDSQLLLNEILQLKPTDDLQLIHLFFDISEVIVALPQLQENFADLYLLLANGDD